MAWRGINDNHLRMSSPARIVGMRVCQLREGKQIYNSWPEITVINCAYTRTKSFNFPLIPFVYLVHPQHPKYFILSSQLTMATATKPPVPPFTEETARIKVKAAQDVWNTKYTLIILSHSCHHIINDTQKSPSSKECIYRRFHLEEPRYIYSRPR